MYPGQLIIFITYAIIFKYLKLLLKDKCESIYAIIELNNYVKIYFRFNLLLLKQKWLV